MGAESYVEVAVPLMGDTRSHATYTHEVTINGPRSTGGSRAKVVGLVLSTIAVSAIVALAMSRPQAPGSLAAASAEASAPQPSAPQPSAAGLTMSLAQADDGTKCLKDEGLAHTEIKKFLKSTMCLGYQIKSHMGIGDTTQMIKDYLEAPMNRHQLMPCLDGMDDKTHNVVKSCLNKLPTAMQASPVAEFWIKFG